MIQGILFEHQDLKYRDFMSKLIPDVDKETIIGIRTPELKKIAKDIGFNKEFISTLPHKYYEENNLHAFMLENIKDYNEAVKQVDAFLPYVDNWATCDSLKIKVFKKNTDKLLNEIKRWISSEHTYTIRYAMGLLLSFYLDDEFKKEYIDMVCSVKSDEYYINMMQSWYLATALAKQYDTAVKYIEAKTLKKFTHNKAIQKAVESYRIPDDKKEYLKTLKISVK